MGIFSLDETVNGTSLWRASDEWSFNMCIPIRQAVPLLRMHPEDSILMFMKKVMFYASAFILSMIHKGKLQNRMYKLQSFHIMEYQSATKQNKFMIQTKTWINIQNIMLTGRGLIQKYKAHL